MNPIVTPQTAANPASPTTPAVSATDEEDDDDITILETRGCWEFYMKEFKDGLFKGVKYIVKRLRKGVTPAEAFEALGLDGDGWPLLLSIANSSIAGRAATKVKNNLTMKTGGGDLDKAATQAKIQKALGISKGGVVFNIDEAATWNPGEREVSVETQAKRLTKLLSEGKVTVEEAMNIFKTIGQKAALKSKQ